MYPQHLTRQRFLSLVDRLQAYPLDDSRIVIVGELLNTIYKAREKAQTSIDAAEDTMYRCDFLSEEELNELSKEFLLRCMGNFFIIEGHSIGMFLFIYYFFILEVCTKKSLDAAFCTAEIFKKDAGIMEVITNLEKEYIVTCIIRFFFIVLKLLANAQERSKAITWIKKGKWQLLKQVFSHGIFHDTCTSCFCVQFLFMFHRLWRINH